MLEALRLAGNSQYEQEMRWGKVLPVVEINGTPWLVKQTANNRYESDPTGEGKKRDYLGFLLGVGTVNIAEVRLLMPDDYTAIAGQIVLPQGSSEHNTYLVRHGNTYATSELPCKTLDEATAYELVYSVFVRRPDADVDNRAYTDDGIPVFFDHHVAFGAYPMMARPEPFFSFEFNSPNRPGMWRVHTIEPGSIVTTAQVRSIDRDTHGADHFVYDAFTFEGEVWDAVGKLQDIMTPRRVRGAIEQAEFSKERGAQIANLLETNRGNIPDEARIMLKIVLQRRAA